MALLTGTIRVYRSTGSDGRLRLCGLLCEQIEQNRPAAVDAFAHRFARCLAHAFEIPVLELDSRETRGLGDESHVDFGGERRPRIRLPV
jgi:hypothetical protein